MARRRPDDRWPPAAPGRRTLRVYLIKPSQYAPDGSLWQFRWGVIPNNTLTVLGGLVQAYAAGHPDVDIQAVLWEELIDGAISPAVLVSVVERARADRVELLIGLAGVQTGQYCRARDLALQLRRLGLPVVMGGFHVSGDAPSRAFLKSAGVSVVIGEAETTLAAVFDDALCGDLQPEYSVSNGIRAVTGRQPIVVPGIENVPLPSVDASYLARFFNPAMSTIDTARGCPFACSYCAVKNIMGRTMRPRSAARVVDWMRDAYDRHAVTSWFVVDDDFYRNPQWQEVLSGLAELRRQGRDLTFMMQVDVDAAADADLADSPRQRRSRRFLELAQAAGCYAVFIGLETFHPANLESTRKVQNAARGEPGGQPDTAMAHARVKAKYRRVVERWHAVGVAVHAGYMIGLPFDGKGCGIAAARNLREIGVDLVSFFPYTPLPGTEDYDAAVQRGELLDRDFNSWDCLHVVHRHPTLTQDEVYREYGDAHRAFYSWRRLAWSVLTKHAVGGLAAAARYGMLTQQIYYTYAYRRGWHPMMGGIWRQKNRSVRRAAITDTQAAALYLGDGDAVPQRPALACADATEGRQHG